MLLQALARRFALHPAAIRVEQTLLQIHTNRRTWPLLVRQHRGLVLGQEVCVRRHVFPRSTSVSINNSPSIVSIVGSLLFLFFLSPQPTQWLCFFLLSFCSICLCPANFYILFSFEQGFGDINCLGDGGRSFAWNSKFKGLTRHRLMFISVGSSVFLLLFSFPLITFSDASNKPKYLKCL